MTQKIVGIPLGTRLHQIVLCDDGATHVWIAIKARAHEYKDWQGTYICINRDGSVFRITRDDALPIDPEPFMIKDADHV